jgi:succinyl-CoA synthetase beta subunit
MKLYEYQAKEIFSRYSIMIPKGYTASSVEEAAEALSIVRYPAVLKAQVLTGKRGKAGGIRFISSGSQMEETVMSLLGMNLGGSDVDQILVEEKINIKRELYLSITLDRAAKKPVVIVSASGGMDIEELAKSNPKLIVKRWVEPIVGFYPHHAVDMFKRLGFQGDILLSLSAASTALYQVFRDYECELVEINPLVLTEDNRIVAADGKMIIDDNGRGISKLGHTKTGGMRYVPLSGDIGILANGAGLTMMTMDVVSYYGGRPANFLEIGGELYKRSEEALGFLLENRNLNGIFVNLFGAYARTDVIIEGIIRCLKDRDARIPIVYRVMGTGEERAKALLKENLGILPFTEMDEAAKEIVKQAAAYKRSG